MLFEQIAKNKRKTIVLFIGFFLFMGIVGAALGYYLLGEWVPGVIIAIVTGIVYAVYMFSQSTDVVMSLNHAQEITNADQAPDLWHIVEDMALVANVPMPRVFIIDDPSPNAFATGNDPEHAAVAATSGILSVLNREELEGVMAHEMTHVRNYDIRIQTIAVALTSAIAMLANFGTHFWYFGGGNRNRDNKDGNIIAMIASILVLVLAPIAATLVQLAISRNREFLADAGAVELTRNPQGLINALNKISQSEPMSDENVSPESAALYIANPLKEKKLTNLFATHPPMSERIAALQKM
ncbi:zinc metalloprotease HtpX [Weissella paramesenteroides]|jgi:heat shock protein HtpX|uniref:zinc metalloprotease HtpX n=1 Tax=Weissella paramesenteroides TaxID=1249 RepID=UPI00112E2F7B|nr:zinc metalloprotease HtpX [Weissella paramesenteroides]KAA8442607.1 zinc metalloprotease HtpX [Weissella paramesenteroides]KAA8442954.1 zinc metalloprotease HtpX [Weissella paramesenteroides]KAA8444371.1 zinc metalloprotease HtpX [Weissella paramesenteroides]KAA8446898.1 zinc metalloprotease HtpX [Weissella paramesenteroides]KAA8448038.1 zinc metalloprotease HtpX [Weissella paramesenteroides]